MASQTFTAAQVLTAAQMNTLGDTVDGYATTATAAGTTTLTVASKYQQYFTGSTTQTVVMPVASTLVVGWKIRVVNNSSGIVTVQSSGANTIYAVPAGADVIFTCILTSGTTAASWDYKNHIATGTSGSMTSIASGSLSGASLVLSSISSSYKDLRLILRGMTFGASVVNMTFKANAITDYAQIIQYGNGNSSGQTVGQWGTGGSTSVGLNYSSTVTDTNLIFNLFDYVDTTNYKPFAWQNYYTIAGPLIETAIGAGWVKSTAAINSVTITPDVSFTGGTYVLYGVN